MVNIASQPVSSGGLYTTTIGTGVGTTVVSDQPCNLRRVFWGGSFVGTANIHDASAAAGTSATSSLLRIGIPLTKYPESVTIDVACKKGILVEATGTPTMTLVWDK